MNLLRARLSHGANNSDNDNPFNRKHNQFTKMTNEKNIVDYIVPVDEHANKQILMRVHFNPNNCEIEYATEYEIINGKINPKHVASQYDSMCLDDPQLKHDMELMRKYAVCTANGHCPCDCPND